MPVLALILFVVAVVLFAAATVNLSGRVNLTAAGLTVLTVDFIFLYTVHGPVVR